MKKVFSLLLVVAMLVSLSVVASAAEPVKGMKHTITETDTDITVTITIGDVTKCSGFVSFLQTDKVTYVDGSAKVLDSRFDTKTNVPTDSSLKFAYGMSSADNYFDEAGEVVIAEYKVTKNNSEYELSAADFAYGTNSIKASKVTTGTNGTVAGVAAGNNFTSAKQAAYFTIEYVDARTKPDPTPTNKSLEEDFSTLDKDSDYKSETIAKDTIVTYGNDGNGNPYSEKMGENGKVHTFFAKTATDLDALSYGVNATIKVNGVDRAYKFPGKAPVKAGQAWAIKIVIPEGTFQGSATAELTSMEKY